MMQSARVLLSLLSILAIGATGGTATQTSLAGKRIVIAASTVLDGKGRVLRDTRIVIENSGLSHLIQRPGRWITTCAG